MTEEQRDDLVTELTLYSPRPIRDFFAEYQQIPRRHDCSFPFYEFLKENLKLKVTGKKSGWPSIIHARRA